MRGTRIALFLVLLGALLAAPAPAFREAVLHLDDGRSIRGLLVDYIPPGVWVVETEGGRTEIAEGRVEQIEFLDVTEKVRRDALPAETVHGRVGDGESFSFVHPRDGSPRRREDIELHRGALRGPSGGANFGHFLDLGEIDPATVDWEVGRLLAAGRNVATYELLAHHTDPAPMRLQERIVPRLGHAYLVRAEGGESDVVVVLAVTKLEETAIEFDWRALLVYGADEMRSRDQAEAADWKERCEGKSDGEGLLWARSEFRDYVKATMSFECGTRDHVEVTHNDWDIEFGNRGPSVAHVNTVTDDRSGIQEVEVNDWEKATAAELPPTGYRDSWTLRRSGLYAVHSVDSETDAWAIFQVTELEPGRWVRFRWRALGKK